MSIKIPIHTLNDKEIIYVSRKQHYRILKRREKRRKLNLLSKFSARVNNHMRPKYVHESRHKHAMKRPRGKGGRFLSKNEMTAIKADGQSES